MNLIQLNTLSLDGSRPIIKKGAGGVSSEALLLLQDEVITNEEVVAAALNDLNKRILDLESRISALEK